MTKKTVYCEECRNDVNYTVEEKEMVGKLLGKQYRYIGKEAKCNRCGAYLNVDEITEFNMNALYDAVEKEGVSLFWRKGKNTQNSREATKNSQ